MIKRTKYSRSLQLKLKQWISQERGSFTLESTLVFPILFLMILLFILLGMYIYQKVVLYYSASITAERTSFSWDNSYRNSRSGMLIDRQYDGLYWRLGEDHILQSLFGVHNKEDLIKLQLPAEENSTSTESELAYRKMAAASEWMGSAELTYQGEMSYSPALLKRNITVKLKQPVSFVPLERMLGRTEPKSVASSTIVDPVEFIRSVDMVRYYTMKFANSSGGIGKSQAGSALAPYQGK